MEEEIKFEFNSNGFHIEAHEEREILKKCLTLCINYKLKPHDFVSSWEVYYLNRNLSESVVRNCDLDGFVVHLQHEQKELFLKEEANLHFYSSRDVESILNKDSIEDEGLGTPPESSRGQSELIYASNYSARSNYSKDGQTNVLTPFERRTNKFVVKFSISSGPCTANNEIKHDEETLEDDIIKRVRPNELCSLAVNGLQPKPGCRFMHDRIEDRFNALSTRIRMLETALCASENFEEPADPTVASQRNVFSVGMISCDGEGRLNDKSVMLQTSVKVSGGQRVRLELNKLDRISLFPGQIIGLEGNNPSGHCFVTSKLIDYIPLSIADDMNSCPSKKLKLDEEVPLQCGTLASKNLSMIVASGPFTTSDNLMFEPLKELLAYASRKKPQLLILIGPFVDSEHPVIKIGNTDRIYDDIFYIEVIKRVHEFVEYMGSEVHVILVPSIRDANHDFVFPQPAYAIHPQYQKDQITSLPNPGIFNVNQVKFGCCSVDVLRHLCGEEMSRNPVDAAGHDRISRVLRHILSQRSFYPLYPPAEDVPLDYSLCPEALTIDSPPDFLIIPSDMKYFVKVLSLDGGDDPIKCVCINPGRLARGEGGGTFVELSYYGNADSVNASVVGI